MKNTFAFTEPGTEYPAFLSINETSDAGQHSVTVRTRGFGGVVIGEIVLSNEQLVEAARQILANLAPTP